MIIHILRCGMISLPDKGRWLHGRKRLPVWSYLIEHPQQGLILVDTGLGKLPLPVHLQYYYRQHSDILIDEQLQKLGVFPADINAVMLSDLDPDHTGGLYLLKEAKHFFVPEEEYFWTGRTTFALRQPKKLWENVVPLERYYVRGTGFGPAKRSYDFFGDGSVQAVLAIGHTFGNCVTVLQENGKKLLLAGNAISSGKTLDDDYVYHPAQQKKTKAWLKDFAADPSCVGILATHDEYETERVITL